MPFSFDLSDKLRKKAARLAKRDGVLARIFKRKIQEVTARDEQTIDSYKNLRSPLHEYKRIHLTDSHVLIFTVDKNEQFILFVDILHWDNAYQ